MSEFAIYLQNPQTNCEVVHSDVAIQEKVFEHIVFVLSTHEKARETAGDKLLHKLPHTSLDDQFLKTIVRHQINVQRFKIWLLRISFPSSIGLDPVSEIQKV
jgi:hypothetical protein